MADTDSILEAEEAIRGMASELKRMRDAANLLQSGEEKAAAVLNGAERVVHVTEEFTLACGDIIKHLSATDLNQHLEGLQSEIGKIAAEVGESSKTTTAAIATLDSKLERLQDQLQTVAKRAKARHVMTTVLILLTLATALATLAKALIPGIGG